MGSAIGPNYGIHALTAIGQQIEKTLWETLEILVEKVEGGVAFVVGK